MLRGLLLSIFLVISTAVPGWAEAVRVAVFNVELDRTGPGLLLRDIRRGADDAEAVAAIVAHVSPDILLLTRFDYDYPLAALQAFNDLLEDAAYPHLFALRPNTGMPTGQDINRNGDLGEPEDAQSYGLFSGQNGMALLSRYPVILEDVRDFSDLLWAELPDAVLPQLEGVPFWGPEVKEVLRLSTVGHWDVPVQIGERHMHLWAFHGSPPIFDGPEDRNGLRAAEEVRFWQRYLDGELAFEAPTSFVILGTSNIDPHKGDGRRSAMADLLSDPRISDPRPQSAGAAQLGDPHDTVAWDQEGGPGNLRVDYVLPSSRLNVAKAGVFWPAPEAPHVDLLGGGEGEVTRHRLVWVDLEF